MTVHTYKTAGGKDLILEYIHGLSKKEIIDVLSVIGCLEENRMDELTVGPWRKGRFGI